MTQFELSQKIDTLLDKADVDNYDARFLTDDELDLTDIDLDVDIDTLLRENQDDK